VRKPLYPGKLCLLDGFGNLYKQTSNKGRIKYWACINRNSSDCDARCSTLDNSLKSFTGNHNHAPNSTWKKKPSWAFFGYFLIKIRKYFVFAVWYVLKKRGSLTHKHLLDANQYVYRCSSKIGDHIEYWRCVDSNKRCLARVSLRAGGEPIFSGSHNHACNYDPRTMTILSGDPLSDPI